MYVPEIYYILLCVARSSEASYYRLPPVSMPEDEDGQPITEAAAPPPPKRTKIQVRTFQPMLREYLQNNFVVVVYMIDH